MVVFSAATARDHLYAHVSRDCRRQLRQKPGLTLNPVAQRFNQESRLPATDLTTAIIKEMLRVGATNSFLIVRVSPGWALHF